MAIYGRDAHLWERHAYEMAPMRYTHGRLALMRCPPMRQPMGCPSMGCIPCEMPAYERDTPMRWPMGGARLWEMHAYGETRSQGHLASPNGLAPRFIILKLIFCNLWSSLQVRREVVWAIQSYSLTVVHSSFVSRSKRGPQKSSVFHQDIDKKTIFQTPNLFLPRFAKSLEIMQHMLHQ